MDFLDLKNSSTHSLALFVARRTVSPGPAFSMATNLRTLTSATPQGTSCPAAQTSPKTSAGATRQSCTARTAKKLMHPNPYALPLQWRRQGTGKHSILHSPLTTTRSTTLDFAHNPDGSNAQMLASHDGTCCWCDF